MGDTQFRTHVFRTIRAKEARQYEVFFPGRPPHNRHPLFRDSRRRNAMYRPTARAHLDCHGNGLEQVSESTAYVPGGVMDGMARWRSPLRR